MNDNALIHDEATTPSAEAAATPPKTGGELFYPLDWETTTVRLKEGRFSHTLRRPTIEQLLDRDARLQTDIPLGKDGSFSMPDPTATEDIDAELYDEIALTATGYKGTVPRTHKSAAFRGLYQREIYVDEDVDLFAETVPVTEEIGQGDEPDFTITHVMRQPGEDELRRYRRRSNTGTVKPGKRGKQRFVSTSTLKLAIEYYDLWLERVEGVRFKDRTDGPTRDDCVSLVDPLIKRMVVGELVDAVAGGLLD